MYDPCECYAANNYVINIFCRIIVTFKSNIPNSAVGLWFIHENQNLHDDVHNPNEYEEDAMGENVQVGNAETNFNGRRLQETSPDFAATMRSLMAEMQSYKVDNEILVKAQEEQNQLNVAMLQNLTDIQRNMNSKDQTERPEGSKNNARRRKRSLSESSDSEGSTGDSSSSSHENQRRRRY